MKNQRHAGFFVPKIETKKRAPKRSFFFTLIKDGVPQYQHTEFKLQ